MNSNLWEFSEQPTNGKGSRINTTNVWRRGRGGNDMWQKLCKQSFNDDKAENFLCV